MPTYQYRCSECGNELEAVQKFTDAALTECPTCNGSLRKVFNAVGVVFKGSGFYRTDSRNEAKKSGSGTSGGSKSDNTSEKNGASEKKSSTTEKKTESSGSKQPATAGSSSGSGSSGGSSSTAA